jgi:hypothetical protein
MKYEKWGVPGARGKQDSPFHFSSCVGFILGDKSGLIGERYCTAVTNSTALCIIIIVMEHA